MRKGFAPIFSILVFAFLTTFVSDGLGAFREERCALCHVQDSPYYEKGVIPGETREEVEERICFSCHLGAVVDSTRVLLGRRQHPPVVIERVSPGGGEVRRVKGCAACHTPHTDRGWKGFAGTDRDIYTGGERLCTGCHDRYGGGSGKHHPGEGERGCLTCHTVHGAGDDPLLKKNYGKLCASCHRGIREEWEKGRGHPVGRVRRRPVMIVGSERVGEEKEVNLSCNLCHDVHEPDRVGGLLKGEANSLCRECHRGYVGGGRGAENNGNHPGIVPCTGCHTVHGENGETAQVRPCSSCHSAEITERGNHRVDAGGGEGCLSCHSVHRGVVGTENLRAGNDTYCLACHEEMNTLNEEKSLPLAHPVFSVPGEEVGARLAAVGGNLGKFGEIICRTCHDLHGAPASRLLRIEPEKTCELCHDRSRVRHGRKEISCLNCHPLHGMKKPLFVGENPARALCLECHGMKTGHPEVETSRQEGTEPLFNKKGKPSVKGIVTCPTCHDPHGESAYPGLVRAPYEGSSFLCLDCHRDKEGITLTPHDLRLVVSENLCEPCHQPHFGSETYMWGVGNMEGSSMAEKLCGSCHREGGFAGPVSIKGGHPVDFIPPSKEGLPLPFFDTFWKENELGMVTCPTCHNVHGEKISALPEQRQGLLNLMYRFGDEVGYIERRNFCSICHRREKAIAAGPHREKECEECHPVHVKGSSEAKKDVARLCLSCHVDVPEKGAFVFSLLGKTKKEGMKVSDSAIFIDETGRISEAGGVSCPSCHDVHTAGVREKGGFPGGNPSEACLSCHPEKSALRDSPHDFGDDICGECHTICRKGFDEKDLREIARDFDANPADARCLICHSDFEEEGFSFVHPKKMRRVKSSYGAIVYVGDPVTMVSRIPGESSLFFPLFDQKGRPRENGSPGCLTCHDPHRDNMETKRTFFLRDPSGYFISAVCQPCHSDGAQEHVLKFHTLKRRVYE